MAVYSSNIDTETKVIVKNASIGGLGQIIFAIFRFLTNAITTRTLGPEFYGIYVLATTIVSYAGLISNFGMDNTIVKYVSQFRALKDTKKLRGILVWGVMLVSVFSIILTVIIYIFAVPLAKYFFHQDELVDVLRIMIISLPFSALTLIFLASMQGVNQIKNRVLVERVQIPLISLICISIAVIMGYKLIGIVWAYVFVSVIGTLLGCYYLIRTFGKSLLKGPILIEKKEVSRFSMPVFFSGLFTRIISSADIIFIGYFLSAANVGIYGVAARIAPLLIMPLNAVNATFTPIISDLYVKNKHDKLEQQFKTTTRHILTVSLPLFTLILFFSKEVLSIFGQRFEEGSFVLITLMIGKFINSATGSSGYMLMMTGRPMINLYNSIILGIFSILMYIFLIPKYGIIGAALANAIAISLVQLLRLGEIWYVLRIHPYQKETLKPIFSCILSAGILLLFSSLGIYKGHKLIMVLLCGIYIFCYAFFLWIFKLPPEDHYLLNNLKKRFRVRTSLG